MRVKNTSDHLTVQAIGGSHVVLLGWDFPRENCDGLLGFAIHRTDPTEEEAGWLRGLKTFEETDPGFVPGSTYSTREHPVQSFMWADYAAKPGRPYDYRVLALKGTPAALQPVAETAVQVRTESPEGGLNDVHFNRGVAASQEYARRFGNRRPSEIGQPAFTWLSRGLFEAMTDFVASCGPGDALRICAYEFHYAPFLAVLKGAVDRGVDLSVIYDDRDEDFPGPANLAATTAGGIADLCVPRRSMKSAISHNKFMVRLRAGTPEAVWTGGTNFSEGGIFGQSNVGEVVEDADIAKKYLQYWELLREDPTNAALKPRIDALTPVPVGKPLVGNSVIFSPRGSLDVLEWYAERAREAEHALFMTFAFGMNDLFKEVYRSGRAPLRFAVMEKASGPKRTPEARQEEEEKIRRLRFDEANLFAIGSMLTSARFDRWLEEKLTGLNSHVRYIHNKFMLIDPLSHDPIVIGGSANFSAASTEDNDENMLIIRGNTRVADIYLGEFMRLYSHHAFREFAESRREPNPKLNFLRVDDWWTKHFGNTSQSRRRAYFAGT
jgi:phosphatidylserine/phosphatidylglycerophosphate/cardiolipin synthase-like enzyme